MRGQYEARMNRAIDFVYANYQYDLDLDGMADAANFSRFHFHRMFLTFTGETPAAFVRRVRLSSAAGMLRKHPGMSVGDIAQACGFSGSSVFSRQFKVRYGAPPSGWRERTRKDSKDGHIESNGDRAPGTATPYDPAMNRPYGGTIVKRLDYRVEVNDLPDLAVAYARHVGAYPEIGEAFARLNRWALPRGLMKPDSLSLAVYHDEPAIVEENKLRSSACLTVPPGTLGEGDIGIMTIPGGSFAVGHFVIDGDEFGAAWDALIGEWIPSSGWQPDDRMCYEIYRNGLSERPDGKFVVDVCEPIRPL